MKLHLIHWNAEEACERAANLAEHGFQVTTTLPGQGGWSSFLRSLQDESPDAVVVDLARLPAQGRDLGIAVRNRASTRRTPLVFVGGVPAKVSRIRELLPDAAYLTWDGFTDAIKRAVKTAPRKPVVPGSIFAAHAATPLITKLGIKPGFSVAVLEAPPEFDKVVGEMPEGAQLIQDPSSTYDLTIWFTRDLQDLHAGIDTMRSRASVAPLWIAWPKKSSGLSSDLTQAAVRQAGLNAGLVDYKICSIDRTWSALLFTRRAKSS